MADQKPPLYEWALDQYRALVQESHPSRLATWPVVSGCNFRTAALPANAGAAVIFDHTGNPTITSFAGIGQLDAATVGTETVTDENAESVQQKLNDILHLGPRDGVVIVLRRHDQAFLPHTQLRALLRKHEIFAGLAPMKVFLSHKGVDKEMVRRFGSLLTQLGFLVWLDDDAMPAGVQPDRAIDQGFRDSCAAVFFVTPDFTDESWLASEIEYARREHREKGDKFAIITLSLSSGGKPGAVPQLLKNFVYKSPAHELEAMYEIIRALPVTAGPIRFR